MRKKRLHRHRVTPAEWKRHVAARKKIASAKWYLKKKQRIDARIQAHRARAEERFRNTSRYERFHNIYLEFYQTRWGYPSPTRIGFPLEDDPDWIGYAEFVRACEIHWRETLCPRASALYLNVPWQHAPFRRMIRQLLAHSHQRPDREWIWAVDYGMPGVVFARMRCASQPWTTHTWPGLWHWMQTQPTDAHRWIQTEVFDLPWLEADAGWITQPSTPDTDWDFDCSLPASDDERIVTGGDGSADSPQPTNPLDHWIVPGGPPSP